MPDTGQTDKDTDDARGGVAPSGPVAAAMASRIAAGTLSPDAGQRAGADALDRLIEELAAGTRRRWLPLRRAAEPRGLYIHGGVGRGKTMLMDMFHDALAMAVPGATPFRLHFHDFMVLAQDEVHAAREAGAADPIIAAADALAARGRVMCFDEMEVRDIADAMILARLFTALFDRGVTLVCTSNRHADELYKNGLHRDRFLPFIALLTTKCAIVEIAAGRDWRADVLAQIPAWYTPDDARALAALDSAFARLAGAMPVGTDIVRVAGREIVFDEVAGDVARTDFASLCEAPLAARDYLAIAGRFAGLVVAGIPRLSDANEPAARRFMWLVDALYDRQRFLIASAEDEIGGLYDGHQFAFEFDRTRSRLGEMTRRTAADGQFDR